METAAACLCYRDSREKTMNVGWEGILEDMKAIQESLAQPDQLIASVKVQHSSIEANLKDLDSQLADSRLALQGLSLRLDEMIKRPWAQQVALDVAVVEDQEPAVDLREAPADVIKKIETKEAVSLEDDEKDPEEEEEGTGSQAANPGLTDNVVLNKLMEEHRNATRQVRSISWYGKRGWWPVIVHLCRRVVGNNVFECVISVVILVNAIMIGVESDLSIRGEDDQVWLQVMEILFLVVYTVEIVIRLIAHKWKAFKDPWFDFDLILVVLSFIGQIFATVLTVPSIIQQVLVLRALRLLRLIRAVRMIKQMRTIWRLVSGLLTSCNTMLSTMALLLLVLYIFAILGIEMIANDSTLKADTLTGPIIEKSFSSLWISFWTLTQFVTMDSIASIYIPLIEKKWELSIYFTLLVVIAPWQQDGCEGRQDGAKGVGRAGCGRCEGRGPGWLWTVRRAWAGLVVDGAKGVGRAGCGRCEGRGPGWLWTMRRAWAGLVVDGAKGVGMGGQ
ncbi:Voltage-dependent T-type calcium channel subunit alpha-1H (Low-voltage-activated calcium channel alpha1 3.2 subunit) (Voltage-gated calcium channel subunit alpha Cav3.2) [Durusdinium trenchii]|uniref:Voltage-dependent T-type calcium channel subunit alpha-1H (Low-voltage-activated calcium channel alpha1 3.2 subunit) (Voltage-gated calcium channel subunit alpha Cav3.2) n=1 Tax=Durusdinium trenchii TaxID=1381693 RepID=A0ABP0MGN5_9DINO